MEQNCLEIKPDFKQFAYKSRASWERTGQSLDRQRVLDTLLQLEKVSEWYGVIYSHEGGTWILVLYTCVTTDFQNVP